MGCHPVALSPRDHWAAKINLLEGDMLRKTINCSAWIFALYAMGAVTPALAADASGWAARAVTWENAFNGDDLKGVVALYAADGYRMPPHEKAVQGSEAILASL